MRPLLPLFLATSLTACLADAPAESESTQGIVTHNMLAANMIAANMIAANMLAANMLSTSQLTDGTLSLNSEGASGLLATADGREVLNYLVSCALPAGTTLSAPDGTQFQGELGLAPSWQDKPLDPVGQAWVSACVFSRCNAASVAVPISLRGSNKALVVGADERASWTLQEGAFYGELFTAVGGPRWFACSGVDNAAAFDQDRKCATEDPAHPGKTYCGFTYTGTCGASRSEHAHFSAARPACNTYLANDYYSACAGVSTRTNATTGEAIANPMFNAVITSYVHP